MISSILSISSGVGSHTSNSFLSPSIYNALITTSLVILVHEKSGLTWNFGVIVTQEFHGTFGIVHFTFPATDVSSTVTHCPLPIRVGTYTNHAGMISFTYISGIEAVPSLHASI